MKKNELFKAILLIADNERLTNGELNIVAKFKEHQVIDWKVFTKREAQLLD
tara:strand:- start:25822 stop:25974 length:153 start_codon:yes stop_codon:yes gene_type:complete